jgi:DNA-binding response OmpR family regulator
MMRAERVSPRVLVVDDEAVILFAVREFLSARGYAVDSAMTADEACQSLSDRRYHAVITDLRLSRSAECEGLTVLRCARGQTPRVPAIVLTALTSGAESAEARRLGAWGVFTKPVDLRELDAAVEQMVTTPS